VTPTSDHTQQSSSSPILASTSPYRAALLARLGLHLQQIAPQVDEAPFPHEAPAALAARLALIKAQSVSSSHPQRWVIGSDQVCACEGRLLGKPGTRENAREQLRQLAGHNAEFHTAVALVRRQPERTLCAADITRVRLRSLTEVEIERYLDAESALDCAGSFKCEGLGISLCTAIETTDPTALVGLPLIAVRRLLADVGFALP